MAGSMRRGLRGCRAGAAPQPDHRPPLDRSGAPGYKPESRPGPSSRAPAHVERTPLMLKTLRSAGLAVVLALTAPACVFANFGHPLDTDVHNTELGSKVGTASIHSVLWLVAWGDSGAAAAAK